MKDSRLRIFKSILFVLSILAFGLASCSLPGGEQTGSQQNPTSASENEATIKFILTADNAPIQVTHADGTTASLKNGESLPISIDDKIKVEKGGLGKLLYSDRINVEILQNTELVVARVTEVTGGRIEATFSLNGGHVHIRTSESGKADVILKTEDSTISTLVDDTDFTVCYAPGADGLTCHPVIQGSIKVFGKEGTMVYDGPTAGYTFNGQAPQPAVCFHAAEYKDWLAKMRNGEDVEALGALVSRWYGEPCPGETSSAMLMETPTAMSMETPTAMSMNPSDYFTEEFNAGVDLSKWPAFKWDNDSKSDYAPQAMTLAANDGYLIFKIGKTYVSNYVLYNPTDYDNVRISISAHNGGQNSNNVSLICRYSHEGWYEFQIGNDGLYSILAFMAVEKKYYTLTSGGSTAILSGMGVNEYSATCKNNELSLSINGSPVISIKENMHQLGAGKVGFGVSSRDIIPVLVEINWFKVAAAD